MMKTEALRLALEALEVANSLVDDYYLPKEKALIPEIEEAITAIKAALEAKDEPVGWAEHGVINWLADKQFNHTSFLYATPSQRTWIGLTDKDWNRSKHTEDFEKGVDWAEAMLKGKNT